MKPFTLFCLLLSATQSYAQTSTLPQIEADLLQSYRQITAARFDNDTIAWNTLETDNIAFRKKLLYYTAQYPTTLTYSFDSLKKEKIDVVSSEDQDFRIYSWDTWQGGTMHDFENVFQYRNGDKIFSNGYRDTSRYGEGYAPFYSQIFTLSSAGKTYYLAVYNGIYSTKETSQSVRVFSLEKGGLNDSVKLFKTKAGLVNAIDVPFDFFSVADRPERPLQLIKYSSQKQQLYIPVVIENGQVTNRFLKYRFQNGHFEYVGWQRGWQ